MTFIHLSCALELKQELRLTMELRLLQRKRKKKITSLKGWIRLTGSPFWISPSGTAYIIDGKEAIAFGYVKNFEDVKKQLKEQSDG